MDEVFDPLRALRSATYGADGAAVVNALGHLRLSDIAQLAGEALLVALAQNTEGARELAAACSKALRERAFDGDDVLERQLEVALGHVEDEGLRSVPVDLEELSWVLEGDGEGRLDLVTGEVWPESAIEYAEETGEQLPDAHDEGRWLWIYPEGSAEGYRDMEAFIARVSDNQRAELFSVAISGKGAFRRFRDVLERWPDEEGRWYSFSEERRRARARSWLRSVEVLSIPGTRRPKP